MTMRAMVLERPGRPLELRELPVPGPGSGEVLIRVSACGVCRTDLHIVDGELPDPRLPLIPGHEIVGRVDRRAAPGVDPLSRSASGSACPGSAGPAGSAATAAPGRENLCDRARFTGYTRRRRLRRVRPWPTSATASRCPTADDDLEAAPLLCAGLIGYRSYRMCGDGVGASASTASGRRPTSSPRWPAHQGQRVYAFTRPGDREARSSPAGWGRSGPAARTRRRPRSSTRRSSSPRSGRWCPRRCGRSARAGVVVCGGIHMSDIPSFPYRMLWGERQVRSVANLDPPRRRRAPRPCGRDPGPDRGRGVPPGERERGAEPTAGGAAAGSGGADDVASSRRLSGFGSAARPLGKQSIRCDSRCISKCLVGSPGGAENPWYDDGREDVMGRRGMSSTEPVQTAVVTLDELRRQHQGHEKRLEELKQQGVAHPRRGDRGQALEEVEAAPEGRDGALAPVGRRLSPPPSAHDRARRMALRSHPTVCGRCRRRGRFPGGGLGVGRARRLFGCSSSATPRGAERPRRGGLLAGRRSRGRRRSGAPGARERGLPIQVSVFMSAFNVHVNRAADRRRAGGVLLHPRQEDRRRSRRRRRSRTSRICRSGKARTGASASSRSRADRPPHRVRPRVGARVRRAERIGLIRYGSRVDVFLPADAEVLVGGGAPRACRRARPLHGCSRPGRHEAAIRLRRRRSRRAAAARGVRHPLAVHRRRTCSAASGSVVDVEPGPHGAWPRCSSSVAMVADILDGRIARLTGATSAFGEVYDSLADVVSFGLAPAIPGLPLGPVAGAADFGHGCVVPVPGRRLDPPRPLLRRAHEHGHFPGLPIPAGAAAASSAGAHLADPGLQPWFIPVVVVVRPRPVAAHGLEPAIPVVQGPQPPPAVARPTLFILALVVLAGHPAARHLLSVLLAVYILSAPAALVSRRLRRRKAPPHLESHASTRPEAPAD